MKRCFLIMTITILLLIACSNGTTYHQGELSTGIIYEFRGEFNFNEFRKENGFYWERTTGDVVDAQTYTEAAEIAQLYMSPLLRSATERYRVGMSYREDGIIFVVNYCLETDSWGIQKEIPEDVRRRIVGEPTIFTINRSTGNVVQVTANRGSAAILVREVYEEGGWRRTIEAP